MTTAVFFHAHPDDEAIATGGTMAQMALAGHRVILVTATRGELGEVEEGFLDPGETLEERRSRELTAAGEVLGVSRQEFLGYRDSGMIGEASNQDDDCFWQADVEEAAERLADILREEQAELLTVYDENGVYGHPDHIQVHRVGIRAAELARTPRVYMATQNRDAIRHMMTQADLDIPSSPEQRDAAENLGVEAERITTAVDVTDFLETKRAAMRAHASQISETSFFLGMSADTFRAVWGTEWYIRLGAEPAQPLEGSLLAPSEG